jgi:hypothetical protein
MTFHHHSSLKDTPHSKAHLFKALLLKARHKDHKTHMNRSHRRLHSNNHLRIPTLSHRLKQATDILRNSLVMLRQHLQAHHRVRRRHRVTCHIGRQGRRPVHLKSVGTKDFTGRTGCG